MYKTIRARLFSPQNHVQTKSNGAILANPIFPAFGNGNTFSAWYQFLALFDICMFPVLGTVTGFRALGTGYAFSRHCHWLHDSPAWHKLQVFPRLASIYSADGALSNYVRFCLTAIIVKVLLHVVCAWFFSCYFLINAH